MPAIRGRLGGDAGPSRTSTPHDRRFVELAVTMDAIPAQYLRYYYFHDEVLAELQARPTTRSEDILAELPDYWAHYIEQAGQDDPVLDPARSRGGIFELELALDAIDSLYNDLGRVLPVNIPNAGHALPGFAEDLVVEVFARVDARGCPRGAQPGPAAARPGPHRAPRRVPVADRRGRLAGRPAGTPSGPSPAIPG